MPKKLPAKPTISWSDVFSSLRGQERPSAEWKTSAELAILLKTSESSIRRFISILVKENKIESVVGTVMMHNGAAHRTMYYRIPANFTVKKK